MSINTAVIAIKFQPNNEYLNLVLYICKKSANMKNQSIVTMDSYQLKAGLTPAIITLLPLFPILFYCVPGINSITDFAFPLIVISALLYILASICRTLGRNMEKKIFNSWGGKPTSVLLRQTDTTIDRQTKARYYSTIHNLLPDLHLPTKSEEEADMENCDEIYDSVSKYLRANTRSAEHQLLKCENEDYGMWRNIYGLKCISIWVATLAVPVYVILMVLGQMSYTFSCFGLVLSLCGIVFQVFVVRERMIKVHAFRYAERLLEILDAYNNKQL